MADADAEQQPAACNRKSIAVPAPVLAAPLPLTERDITMCQAEGKAAPDTESPEDRAVRIFKEDEENRKRKREEDGDAEREEEYQDLCRRLWGILKHKKMSVEAKHKAILVLTGWK